MSEVSGIINILKDSFDGSPWHGPSLIEIISKIPADKAETRINKSHSVIEIVFHIIAWRNFVIHNLQGDESYDVADADNFPRSNNWSKAIVELEQSQQQLLAAISDFDEKKLHSQVPHRKYSYYKLLHGIVQHDIYHQGQIVMITKQF